jgi:hypothetical protein
MPLHEDDKTAIFETLSLTLSYVMRGLMLTTLLDGVVIGPRLPDLRRPLLGFADARDYRLRIALDGWDGTRMDSRRDLSGHPIRLGRRHSVDCVVHHRGCPYRQFH